MKIHVDAQVEVDPYDVLESISTEELADVLASRRAVAKSAGTKAAPIQDPIENLVEGIDRLAMEEALWHWRNGRSGDAIYFLEKALGRPWSGLSDSRWLVAA